MTTIINQYEYPLATTLRVAYKLQGLHEHKPYTEVFASIDEMTLEQQIDILYTAFEVANPEKAKSFSRKDFLDYYLDNYDLSVVMEQMKGVVEGILGKSVDDLANAQPNLELVDSSKN